MIHGSVNTAGFPLVRLRLRGPTGAETAEDFHIDTGFNGAVTVPRNIVGYLGLAYTSSIDHMMGDGSSVMLDTFLAEVEWDGVWRPITVTMAGGGPLLGRELLEGHQLSIAHVSGGLVEINPLP